MFNRFSSKRAVICLILTLLANPGHSQEYATVYFINGDRISGRELRVDEQYVYIRKGSNAMRFRKEDVKSIALFDDLALAPDADAEKHFRRAEGLLELGLREQAKGRFLEAIEEFPKYAEAHYRLGLLLKEEGKVDEALGYFGHAATINPAAYSVAPEFKAAGDRYLAAEEHRKAADAYVLLFRHYADHEFAESAAYTAGFLLAEELKAVTEALKTLGEATVRFPDSIHLEKATYLIGFLQSQAGQAEPAIQTLDNFIFGYPDSPWLALAHLARGNAYLQLKQNESATFDFTLAYENSDDFKVRREAETKRNESAWTVYTVSDGGLPSNDVQALAVDGDTLWIGTPKGLAKIDISLNGWRPVTDVNYLNTLFDEEQPINVRALAVDDRELWIGTLNRGVIQYDKPANIPENHDRRGGLPDNQVYDIKLDEYEVWVGTFSGVARFRRAVGEWIVYDAENDNLPADDIVALAVTPQTVWIGTSQKGMAIFDRQIEFWRNFGEFDNLDLKLGSAIVSFDISGDRVYFTWYHKNRSNGYGIIQQDELGRYNSEVTEALTGGMVPLESIYIAVGGKKEAADVTPAIEELEEEDVPAPDPAVPQPLVAETVEEAPLWLATNDGMYIYSQGWAQIGFPTDRLGVPTVNCIALGGGYAWVGASNGVAKIDMSALMLQGE